jgi:hypothetical protein
MPPTFQAFMTASTQASAALIGLLFVSISIAPGRVFGAEAEGRQQAVALSAFTALANIFFISFATLIPDVPIGPVVIAISIPATLQTLSLLGLVRHWRAERILRRGLSLFLASAAIYGYEMVIGIQLWEAPSNTGALTGLLELLLGAYAIGLGRAWELLGAPRSGFGAILGGLIRAALGRGRGDKPPDQQPPGSATQ